MNIVLQNAVGVREFASCEDAGIKNTAVKLLIIFIVINILWVFFARILPLIFSGPYCYVLLFPVSVIVYNCAEYLTFKNICKSGAEFKQSSSSGVAAAALFICLDLSNSFLENMVLSFGFTAGIFLVYLILLKIKKRASLETVPRFFRGNPLTIISMGLLSLVFSTASQLIFRMVRG